jgi:hypothetical protein
MICNVHLSRQAPDIHEGKLALTQKRARVFSRSGLIVSEVPRELGHRSSDVLMASVGLEVSATVRGCAAAIVIASEGYAISQNAAVLDTGTNAVGNAALSRFELAELEKQEVSLVAVVPSDALAATLVDRSTGGDSGAAGGAGPPLPMHLGGLLAGAVCVRYGDPRRATAQLEEVLRALEGVGVQMPDKTTTAAADGLRDHDDDDDDDDEVSQSAQVASPTSAAASSGHTATTAGVGDATAEGQADAAAVAAKRLALHAKAVAAAEKALDEATAAQAQAQAAVDTAKKKKDKKAAEDVLSEKTAVVEETKAALAKVQADEPSKQTTTEDATASGSGSGSGSGAAPNRGDGSQTKQKKKTTSTTNETESLAAASAPSAGGKSTPEKRAGRVRSERASSVAAGQRVAALTADVRFAPSQFEMSRAAEMRQQDAVDDDALRECAVLVLPPAR